MRLFLCEKPSQGRDIAAILGATKRGTGFLQGPGVTVTWAVGHLLENASPEAYGLQFARPWNINALPVLPAQWQMTVKKDTEDQFKAIAKLLKQVDEVVIATDADREGEVIARELLDFCQWRGPVNRLWLSALDEQSIRDGLSHIKPGRETEALYYAGLGRARADWLTGMNLTRLYTLKAREKGFDGVLSVGRVQTPTLALLVNRDREIAAFVPKPFWQVSAVLQAGGVSFTAHWVPATMYTDEEKRCVHQGIAQQVAQLCRQAGQAQVLEQEKKREKEAAPLAFSLGALQQACGKLWQMSPQQVLDTAQSLYETHKATTYPRTDCGFLPESMRMREEIPQVLAALAKTDPSVMSVIATLDPRFVSRIWNDKKLTAHHGIIPTKHACDLGKMNDTEKRVYELIRRHYLAQFLPLHESDVTRLGLSIGGQLFRTTGRVVVVPGWKVLFSSAAEHKDDVADDQTSVLPALNKGDACSVTAAEVKELKTKAPLHFTFDTLIAAMMNAAAYVTDLQLKKVLKENAGLGTEATRAGIIDTLLKRGYIVIKGRNLLATDVAMDLIDALPAPLKEPGMTALWEQALDEVAAGRMRLGDFMTRQTGWTQQLVAQGLAQNVAIRVPPTPLCPLCGSKTRLRRGDKGAFYSCEKYPSCKGVINVPDQAKKKPTKPKSRKPKQN